MYRCRFGHHDIGDDVNRDGEDDGAVVLRRDAVQGLQIAKLKSWRWSSCCCEESIPTEKQTWDQIIFFVLLINFLSLLSRNDHHNSSLSIFLLPIQSQFKIFLHLEWDLHNVCNTHHHKLNDYLKSSRALGDDLGSVSQGSARLVLSLGSDHLFDHNCYCGKLCLFTCEKEQRILGLSNISEQTRSCSILLLCADFPLCGLSFYPSPFISLSPPPLISLSDLSLP